MSTDTPYAWGNPPWDNKIEDVWQRSVEDTAEGIISDLNEIVYQYALDNASEYYKIAPGWEDQILDIREDFDQEIAEKVIQQLKLIQ